MSNNTQKFEEWAVVELFGHQRIAGKVSEATIGGCAFVRVDVPQTAKPAYTKYFGNGAIYAMTPCDEAVAHLAAVEIERFNLPIRVHLPTVAQIPASVGGGSSNTDGSFGSVEDDEDDEDDRAF